MKTLVTLVLLTLICFLRHHSSAAPFGLDSVTNEGCCLRYNQTQIPKGWVRHMAMTSGDCTPKAIVITTVCDRKVCVDPNWDWAIKRLAEFKKSSAKFNLHKCTKKI